MWKLTKKKKKKKGRKNFFGREIVEVGVRTQKKVVKYSGQPPPPETNFSLRPWWAGCKLMPCIQ
jgi:hypothetical protein